VVTIDRGELQTEGAVDDYLRYRITESGVSPRALPGVTGAEQIVNSYDHDEHGWANEDAAMRDAQNEKRMRKLDLVGGLVPPPQRYGPEDAEISVVLFGSTKMPMREAIRMLDAEGISVDMLQVVTVWPFPAEEVAEFVDSAKTTAVIEGNATGQLEGLIREMCGVDVDHHLHRYDGRPFAPEQICDFVREVLG
jgi:2-oxoglutarate ferredoxin oxidoreductase subunit alpha